MWNCTKLFNQTCSIQEIQKEVHHNWWTTPRWTPSPVTRIKFEIAPRTAVELLVNHWQSIWPEMQCPNCTKNCTMSCAPVGCQSFWQTSSIAHNTWCYLAAHDDDKAGDDGGHWRWWGLSKSHAWYYRWNERPPPGLIIRPGSPLIYRLSRTSPLLLLLHSFIICWIAQTSSLRFFHSTSTSLSTVSHWPWLQVS